jgi:hypothetical protein
LCTYYTGGKCFVRARTCGASADASQTVLANSANKCQPTVTMNQILTQNWFLLQNIKDSSLNLTFAMVFSTTENGHTALLPVWPVSAKISKFKLKQVYATKNTSIHSRVSVDIRVRPKSQRLL